MTLDEAVALLREATSYLDDVVRSAPEKWKWTDEQREAHDLMRRIDAALAAHNEEPAELDWAREYLPHAQETRLVARTEDFVFHIRGDGGCMLYEGNNNPYGYHHTVDQAKAHAAEIVKQARSAR